VLFGWDNNLQKKEESNFRRVESLRLEEMAGEVSQIGKQSSISKKIITRGISDRRRISDKNKRQGERKGDG
jgi:hypothetical protein